jgi:multidrug efflux pump subunit AcrB
VPMFLLSGVAKYLFVPLAESVVFAVMASYVLSRTLVPTLAMYLLASEHPDDDSPGHAGQPDGEHHHGEAHAHAGHEEPEPHQMELGEGEQEELPMEMPEQPKPGQKKEATGILGRWQQGFERGFENIRGRYGRLLAAALRGRWVFAIIFLAVCLGSLPLAYFLGEDFFPTVDAGQFKLHFRAKTGTRIEETAKLADQIEQVIRQDIPASQLDGILDNLGLPYSGINTSYSNSGVIGSADGDVQVQLKGHGLVAKYQRQLRIDLPKKFPGTMFMFQPADIVSQILNFGLPAPIDIKIVGANVGGDLALASKIVDQLKQVPGAVDVHIQQPYDSPRFNIEMNRSQAQQLNITAHDIATSVLVSLSGSFQTSPTFFLDPKNGVTYNIAVQAPQYNISSLQDLENVPIRGATASATATPQILANVADITRNSEPGAIYHYNIRPTIDIYANVQDTDLGSVSQAVDKIVAGVSKDVPKGSEVNVLGQVLTMNQSFKGLAGGLVGAIVLVYLLMVVNFQSWSEPFIIIMALPGALAGIVWMLFLTGTTLSVPALMGAIMCIGVATANSILVISFAKERFAELKNAHQAVHEAGLTRLRPVIMTALAMIIGMVPMSLGLGEGGEQNAPLGRAVIGGLVVATVATLFFVPVVYTIVRGRRGETIGDEDENEDGGAAGGPARENRPAPYVHQNN